MNWASADLGLTSSRITTLADFGKLYGGIIAQMPVFKTLMLAGPVLPGLVARQTLWQSLFLAGSVV
jgi:hypothetical protein